MPIDRSLVRSTRPVRPKAVRLATAGVVAALALAGCTGSDDPPDDGPDDSVTTTAARTPVEPFTAQTHDMSDAIPLPTSGSRLADAASATPGDPGASAAPTGGAAPTATASPDDQSSAPVRRMQIVAPRDGDTVSGDVAIEVEVSGFELVELTGGMEDDRGHLFAFVDEQPPAERVRLPAAEYIVASESSTIDLGELSPGEHTVIVIATHAYPVPFEPRVSEAVTFTVDG